MTNDAYSTAGRDILGADARLLELPEKAGAYYYKATPVRIGGKTVIHWKVGLFDVSGGLNIAQGSFENHYDRSLSSTLDTRFPTTLVIPPSLGSDASPDPTGNAVGMHSCRPFGLTDPLIACGATDDLCLFTATGNTVTAIAGAGGAGRPGASFTCCTEVPSNGATMVVLGRIGAVPFGMTAIDGTKTDGHASLSPTWGVAPTPFGYNLFYAAGAIWSQADSGAISAAPVDTGTDVRNGGYVLGVCKLGGGPARMYMWVPNATTTAGGLLFGTEKQGQIYSVNLEGYDLQPLNFEPTLPWVTWAVIVEGNILASDGRNQALHTGQYVVPLNQFLARNLGAQSLARGAVVIGHDVYIRSQAVYSSSSQTWWDFLDLDKLRWHQMGKPLTYASVTSNIGILPGGSFPWQNLGIVGRMYNYEQTAWNADIFTMSSVNSFDIGVSVSNPDSVARAASGDWTSPNFTLPGLEGMGKVLRAIHYLNNPVNAGTTGTTPGSVLWEEVNSGVGWTWPASDDFDSVSHYFPENHSIFDKFQAHCTLTQNSGGAAVDQYTPNGLPVIFEGWASYDRDFIARLGQPPERLELAGR